MAGAVSVLLPSVPPKASQELINALALLETESGFWWPNFRGCYTRHTSYSLVSEDVN
jgi:hypothetical protein